MYFAYTYRIPSFLKKSKHNKKEDKTFYPSCPRHSLTTLWYAFFFAFSPKVNS